MGLRVNNWLLLSLTAITFLASCSLKAPDHASLTVDLSGISSGSRDQGLFAPRAETGMISWPLDVSQFSCLAVNVYGPGIGIPPTGTTDSGKPCGYPGVSVIVDPSNPDVDLLVPAGLNRTVQVIGVLGFAGTCPVGQSIKQFTETNPGLLMATLGQTSIDLFGDQTVEINNTYDPAHIADPFACRTEIPVPQPPVPVIPGPQISALANQNIVENGALFLNFTVSDATVPAAALVITAVSSNQTLVPNAHITIGGSDGDRHILLSPAPYLYGSTTITITVSNGVSATETSFGLNVISDGMGLAELVLGQPDMISSGFGTTASSFWNPAAIASDGTHLFVVDRFNYRVLQWNSIPVTNGAPADVVIGQVDMTSAAQAVTSSGLTQSQAVAAYGGKLIVADTNANRVLVWDTIPTVSGAAANFVLGQSTFTSATIGSGASGFYSPMGLAVAGSKLFVTDRDNNRVLIWNTFPAVSSAPASIVVGQLSMSGNLADTTAGSFRNPRGIASDGTRLVVADDLNHRVLIWNTIPSADGVAADVVLGQPNMTTNVQNYPDGLPHANSLNEPIAVAISGTRLYVADSMNNRVLYWNTIPTSNQQPADGVLGQPDFTSNVTLTNAQQFNNPTGICVVGTKIFITDWGNNRVLAFPVP